MSAYDEARRYVKRAVKALFDGPEMTTSTWRASPGVCASLGAGWDRPEVTPVIELAADGAVLDLDGEVTGTIQADEIV